MKDVYPSSPWLEIRDADRTEGSAKAIYIFNKTESHLNASISSFVGHFSKGGDGSLSFELGSIEEQPSFSSVEKNDDVTLRVELVPHLKSPEVDVNFLGGFYSVVVTEGFSDVDSSIYRYRNPIMHSKIVDKVNANSKIKRDISYMLIIVDGEPYFVFGFCWEK